VGRGEGGRGTGGGEQSELASSHFIKLIPLI